MERKLTTMANELYVQSLIEQIEAAYHDKDSLDVFSQLTEQAFREFTPEQLEGLNQALGYDASKDTWEGK